jgi:hypothetical protein
MLRLETIGVPGWGKSSEAKQTRLLRHADNVIFGHGIPLERTVTHSFLELLALLFAFNRHFFIQDKETRRLTAVTKPVGLTLSKAIRVIFLASYHADLGNFWIDTAVFLTVWVAVERAVYAQLNVF